MYEEVLGISIVICLFAYLYNHVSQKSDDAAGKEAVSPLLRKFRAKWLLVYFTAMAADWLMGPYLYSLYSGYGYSGSQIANFFLIGFSSSMVFGTIVGSMSDHFGRKKFSILMGILYGSACFLKIRQEWQFLALSHLLSGMATSLLHSVIEAWMVCEHFQLGFPGGSLSGTFAIASVGNSLIAIASGLVATYATRYLGFGSFSPFLLSGVLFYVCSGMVFIAWKENYGKSDKQAKNPLEQSSFWQILGSAFSEMKKDVRLPLLGLAQSLFEGSMYTFVFMWVPILEATKEAYHIKEPIPFGVVFSTFMVAIMTGSTLFSMFTSRNGSLYKLYFALLIVSFASFSLCSKVVRTIGEKYIAAWGLDPNGFPLFSFFLFELSCGLYFPTAGTLRGQLVPESVRTVVSNIFRIPLNLFVVIVLRNMDALELSIGVFTICAAAQIVAFICILKVSVTKSIQGKKYH